MCVRMEWNCNAMEWPYGVDAIFAYVGRYRMCQPTQMQKITGAPGLIVMALEKRPKTNKTASIPPERGE